MKQYIGTKIVQARPAFRVTCEKPDCRLPNQTMTDEDIELAENDGWTVCDRVEGYEVRYEDGYRSWSPKDVFEKAYRLTSGMPFGLAIEAAKMGKKITRAGWNGKNQYVELADCISYRNAAGEAVNAQHDAIGNKALAFVGTSGVQMGWLASQADMLADDWHIVE